RRWNDLAARYEQRERASSGAGRRLLHRDRLRVVAPEPPQCVRQHRCPVPVAVAVLTELDPDVVARKLESGGHRRILELPAPGVIPQILPAGLHEHAERTRLAPANQAGEPIGAPEVAEAADPRDDAPKMIRPVPRRDECADAARAQAGDAVI